MNNETNFSEAMWALMSLNLQTGDFYSKLNGVTISDEQLLNNTTELVDALLRADGMSIGNVRTHVQGS